MDWRSRIAPFNLLVIIISLSMVLACCGVNTTSGTIDAFKAENAVRSFEYVEATFGPESDGRRGVLYKGEPVDGCSEINPPRSYAENFTVSKFVLLQQGGCDFAKKVFNAQLAGYVAAIIHNVNSNKLIRMESGLPEVEKKICIPAVFIGQDTANILNDSYLHHDPGSPYLEMVQKQFCYVSSFILVVGVCSVAILCLVCIRFIRDYRSARHPLQSLTKLPVKKFEKGDEFDVCAICLADYEEGDVLRILPCQHAYHCKCVDHWLINRKRICPLCKRTVLSDDESSISLGNVAGSTVDENTLLLMPTSEAASTNVPRYGIGYSVRTPFTNYWCFYGQRRVSTLFTGNTRIEVSDIEAAQETPSTSAQDALRFSAGMSQYQSQEFTPPHTDVTTEYHTVNETIITARSPDNLESQLETTGDLKNQEDIIAI